MKVKDAQLSFIETTNLSKTIRKEICLISYNIDFIRFIDKFGTCLSVGISLL